MENTDLSRTQRPHCLNQHQESLLSTSGSSRVKNAATAIEAEQGVLFTNGMGVNEIIVLF